MQKKILTVLALLALGYATAVDPHMWVTGWGVAEQGLRWAGRHLSKA